VGIDVLSDGEYRRASWASDFTSAVEGYVPGEAPITLRWQTDSGVRSTGGPLTTGGRVIGEKLRQARRLTEHESAFLRAHAPGPYKVTIPAASYIVARGFKPGVSDKAYRDRAAVLKDVSDIIGAEVKALIAEGVRYIQIDNPHYPDYIDADRKEQMRAIGIDPEKALREDIEADNACLAGIDRNGVTLAMHLCRGNGGQAGWHTQGGYDPIAEQVFGSINVDRFLLEYDSERAGGFEPLRFMPKDKVVVLGLVTTKAGTLEPQSELMKRIEEASVYVDMENLALSPQCGFASVMAGNPLTETEQWQKLRLVVETARKAWPD
jgi:5-methyltetrahydropteroyltriglutamate--homocysteine methyltransferase